MHKSINSSDLHPLVERNLAISHSSKLAFVFGRFHFFLKAAIDKSILGLRSSFHQLLRGTLKQDVEWLQYFEYRWEISRDKITWDPMDLFFYFILKHTGSVWLYPHLQPPSGDNISPQHVMWAFERERGVHMRFSDLYLLIGSYINLRNYIKTNCSSFS